MGPRPYLSGVHSLLLITVRIRSRVPVTCFPQFRSIALHCLSTAQRACMALYFCLLLSVLAYVLLLKEGTDFS